jgi:hypothetical protein
VIFSLKDLKLIDEATEIRFFTTGMEGESAVQQWHCDCCDATLFLVAPQVTNLDSGLTIDWIGVGVFSDQGSGGKETQTMEV